MLLDHCYPLVRTVHTNGVNLHVSLINGVKRCHLRKKHNGASNSNDRKCCRSNKAKCLKVTWCHHMVKDDNCYLKLLSKVSDMISELQNLGGTFALCKGIQ